LVARLGKWRNGPDFEMPKTQRRQPAHGDAILVVTGCQPNGILEFQTKYFHRLFWCREHDLQCPARWGEDTCQADQLQGQAVGGFRVQLEKKGTEERVHPWVRTYGWKGIAGIPNRIS